MRKRDEKARTCRKSKKHSKNKNGH